MDSNSIWMESNLASKSVFFDAHIAFFFKNKIFIVILELLQTLKANADKTAAKKQNFFYKCVLELYFATINGLGEPSC
jgi:hypothetical protein